VAWPAFPALALVTSGALSPIVDIAEGLDVDTARMHDNLDLTGGMIMAEAVSMKLAEKIGKADAHKLIEAASRKAHVANRHLKEVLADDEAVIAHLPAKELAKLFDPLNYQGVAQLLIDRLLASAQAGK
jgi:3-carboxy-cis,cis-muconate cycloisomerase